MGKCNPGIINREKVQPRNLEVLHRRIPPVLGKEKNNRTISYQRERLCFRELSPNWRGRSKLYVPNYINCKSKLKSSPRVFWWCCLNGLASDASKWEIRDIINTSRPDTSLSSWSSFETLARTDFCCSHYVRGGDMNPMLVGFREGKCQCGSCYIALLLPKGGSRQCVPLIEKASLNMYQSLAWLRMWNSTVTFIQRWAEAWLKCQLWQEGILSLSARAWAAHLNALFWKLLGRVFQKKAFKVYTSIFRNLLNLDKICSCFLNGGHRPLLVLLSFWSSLETTHPMLHQPLCGQYMRVLVHLFLSIGLALKLHF